jgi:hypothetical protein
MFGDAHSSLLRPLLVLMLAFIAFLPAGPRSALAWGRHAGFDGPRFGVPRPPGPVFFGRPFVRGPVFGPPFIVGPTFFYPPVAGPVGEWVWVPPYWNGWAWVPGRWVWR